MPYPGRKITLRVDEVRVWEVSPGDLATYLVRFEELLKTEAELDEARWLALIKVMGRVGCSAELNQFSHLEWEIVPKPVSSANYVFVHIRAVN